MSILTIYRLAEQAQALLEGDTPGAGTSVDIDTIKISCGQVINSLLKTDYLTINGALNETIPNGSVLAFYEGIDVVSSNGKSVCTLPIKPLKLPRNMGVWGIYPRFNNNSNYELDKEFIPLQLGQSSLIKSQPMINELFGQIGYEVIGDKVWFTKDIKNIFPEIKLAMRMVIMDINQYGDFDLLPLPPEMEWSVIQEVFKMYSNQPIPDKLVDATVKENKGVPTIQQKQS